MGSESQCRVETAENSGDGKALLETDEIVFRGDFRLVVRFAEITSVRAGDGVLTITTKDRQTVRFHLGRAADRWAEKIRRPPPLLEKLGVKAGLAVTVDGAFDPTFTAEIEAAGARLVTKGADAIFLAVDDTKRLARIDARKKAMRDDAAIWVVYPKGRKDIREADVLGAGRGAGLKDVKVARFSNTHTALKFVVPLADRRAVK